MTKKVKCTNCDKSHSSSACVLSPSQYLFSYVPSSVPSVRCSRSCSRSHDSSRIMFGTECQVWGTWLDISEPERECDHTEALLEPGYGQIFAESPYYCCKVHRDSILAERWYPTDTVMLELSCSRQRCMNFFVWQRYKAARWSTGGYPGMQVSEDQTFPSAAHHQQSIIKLSSNPSFEKWLELYLPTRNKNRKSLKWRAYRSSLAHIYGDKTVSYIVHYESPSQRLIIRTRCI